MYLQSNSFKCACLLQMLSILFNKISFISVTQQNSLIFSLGNTSNYSLSSIKRAAWLINFKPRSFLIPWRIAQFFLDSALTGKKYVPKPKIIYANFSGISLPTSAYNVLNWHNTYPRTRVWRYWLFAPALRLSDASRVMFKFQINNKNSPGLPLSNKAILNS